METDFVALLQYLEGAWLQARGNDDTTRKVRSVLDRLIEDVLRAEPGRPTLQRGAPAFIRETRASQ
jgi:hypothetical protein